jgi:uncharacterized protein YjiS (DUF1127 family)
MEMVMSTVSTAPASSEALTKNSWTTGSAVLKRWWVAHLTWRLQQTAIAQLKALSDRDLKDIGVRRCEIESAVKGGLKRERACKSYR